MKAKFRGAVVVLLALIAGVTYWQYSKNRPIDGTLVLYGNVDIREVELAFRQPGRLLKMMVDEGATVKAGDIVAELDAQPYRNALAVAEADVRHAQAELDKLQRGNRPQEIRRAEESVRQTEAVFRKADNDFRRQSELASTRVASRETLEAARAVRDEAAAALASAQQALSLQKEGSRLEDIAAAQARRAGAEATRAQARTALDDTQLVASADAIVLSRVREPGSMVDSHTAVYILSLRDPVYVRAYVSEPHLGRIAPGVKVKVRTDSSSKIYQGHIGFISPRAEFTPKSVETTDLRTSLVYRLRIVVTSANEGLRQGMPVTVTVETAPAG
ncbi:MAG TPA: secretion protein HlyD [Candidatus Competibacteraceae bacterium]|nr:secretion protein HlyD [Candidatus Competibacteraceae bacterium]MCP5133545.1 secretion protein HlyD [Gammaproteobacteria bacterium]HPF58817.1 secretion protein HlyD [Candidatus Competibacteraceae bacterium]